MKNPLAIASAAILSILPAVAADDANQNNWVGNITASEQVVQVGNVPSVNWDVSYPLGLADLVTLKDNSITTKTEVVMETRMIGAGWGLKTNFHYVEGKMRVGSSSFFEIFYGDHWMIDSSKVVYTNTLPAGTVIHFSGRGAKDKSGPYFSQWSSLFTTEFATPNIVTLTNGDPAPQYDPAFDIQMAVEDYLTPYVDTQTGLITLGPRDIIYLFDFNSYGTKWYDLQDMGILVTFTEKEQN
ncbi:hypothetical protein [Sulfuriroseicoccus oceanibius]|uniref:Uncharacterized protein n=1 Tax=Sulfuriroseicoccus oceanibius TaxID=2707525 RepID=A0A6B3L8I7_9BACT|nr:hypothetical protein [Sulfuriroseicoccus oceanibius]QQL45192.1 hypothetical protein G3M56_000975 [Sulfuriroseicoccus oceanibius]